MLLLCVHLRYFFDEFSFNQFDFCVFTLILRIVSHFFYDFMFVRHFLSFSNFSVQLSLFILTPPSLLHFLWASFTSNSSVRHHLNLITLFLCLNLMKYFVNEYRSPSRCEIILRQIFLISTTKKLLYCQKTEGLLEYSNALKERNSFCVWWVEIQFRQNFHHIGKQMFVTISSHPYAHSFYWIIYYLMYHKMIWKSFSILLRLVNISQKIHLLFNQFHRNTAADRQYYHDFSSVREKIQFQFIWKFQIFNKILIIFFSPLFPGKWLRWQLILNNMLQLSVSNEKSEKIQLEKSMSSITIEH